MRARNFLALTAVLSQPIIVSSSANAVSAIAASDQGATYRAEDELNVVFIGDSITQGVMVSQAPPAYSAIYLLELGVSRHVEIANQGVSGKTTVDFLPDRHELFDKVEEGARNVVRRHAGKLVFSIMLGTNDSATTGPNGSPVSPKDYRKNLIQIIDRLLLDFPKSVVVIHRPTWYSPNTHNGALYMATGLNRLISYFSKFDAVVEFYRESRPGRVYLGDKIGFDLMRTDPHRYLTPEAGQDGVFYLHPNEEGARLLGSLWAIAIKNILVGK